MFTGLKVLQVYITCLMLIGHAVKHVHSAYVLFNIAIGYNYFVDLRPVNLEDLEETPDYFTVEDDDFGLKSLVIFKSAATYLSRNDCYHEHKSRNSITLHATVCSLPT